MAKLGWALPKYYEAGVAEPYRKSYELAKRAEDAGFAMIGVPHHSFTPDTEDYAAPLLMMAALAARTRTIRIASTIFILPLHSPVSIAEQLTELDRISGGRVTFGVGAGYRKYENAGFGVDFTTRGKRMDEMLEIIQRAFESGYLESDGQFCKIPRSELAPAPVQRPGPPIWVGGTADAMLRRGARFANGWISENLYMLDALKERISTFHRLCDEAMRPRGEITVIRNAYVAETRAQAEAQWLPSAIEMHLFNRANYRKVGIHMPDPDGVYARLEAGKKVEFGEFIRERAIAGTPDDCIEQIKLWERETACDYIHLASGPYITTDAEFEAQKRFIDLFAKEIIPAL
jgi:probable F420-dependent oxidoreductase